MPQVKVNGINLYYEIHGAGEPLLFIHGLGSSTRDWEAQVPEFSKNYRVITFDLRGHGQSDKPAGPYSMEMFASDTAGLLQALEVGPAHVVGISLGGGVAFQLALDHPELVKTLVIVNSAPATGASATEAQKEIESRIGIVRQLGMRQMGQVLSPRLFPKEQHAQLRETFVERWAENDPDAYVESLLAMAPWNVMDRIGSIRCPTLVIAADQDYSPVAVKEAYIKQMPQAELVVIPDSHHATPMEEPQTFNAALMRFLRAHS